MMLGGMDGKEYGALHAAAAAAGYAMEAGECSTSFIHELLASFDSEWFLIFSHAF